MSERALATWIYFAASTTTSLASTLGLVLSAHFLWRAALNSRGALIPNVRKIKEGDRIVVAWRHPAKRRTAYLRCRVAAPLFPVRRDTVIDRLTGPDAHSLIAEGYPASAPETVEGIRLDEIEECYFDVSGAYGGNNAIHPVATDDIRRIATAGTIPPEEATEVPKTVRPRPVRGLRAVRAVAPATSVDHLEIQATGDERAFDAYVMVDWSSSSQPATGIDSIWIAMGAWSGRTFTAGNPINVRTRMEAVNALKQQLVYWRAEDKRVLVGFDFAFGYPAGFAAALGLTTSDGAWKALHSHFAAHVRDSPMNAHNRDMFAEECNRMVGAPGPFWGCTRVAATVALTRHRVGVFSYPHHGLAEWRATDLEAKKRATTQSVWKLNCGVSVGGQTILGIKHLDDLARVVSAHRWPFEGWGIPRQPAIWFAEIFPSLVHFPEWTAEYAKLRDRTQVQSCLRWAAERDRDRLLEGDFDRPGERLNATTLDHVEHEEGWILWG